MLEMIGLGREAEHVYQILLNATPATTGDLVAATGLSRPVVRAALQLLQSHNLVGDVAGPPHSYVALDPTIPLDLLLLRHEERLTKARARAREAGERFRRAAAGRGPDDTVELVTDHGNAVQRLSQIQQSARQELRYFDKPPYLDPSPLNDAELDLLRRGGRSRSLYELTVLATPARRGELETYLAAGEQARFLPRLPSKLVIVDDRLAVVSLHSSSGDGPDIPPSAFVIVHRSDLLDAFCTLFETLWRVAPPLGPDGDVLPEPAEAGPDPLERRILGLMNAGLPDEAMARHLGLSHRTLQRRIHGLMDRLDAHTRYQLGVQAVARGWIDPAEHGDGVDDSRQE